MNNTIAFSTLLLILITVNVAIFLKEKHLSEGQILYLELAPVDPRSLMQGDYMALQFKIATKVNEALFKTSSDKKTSIHPSDGHVIVKLDNNNIALFIDIYDRQVLAENELLLHYRIRNGKVKFATNAFFFQEGHAKYYEKALYGQFRVNKSGDPLLVAMFDEEIKKLGPPE